MSRKTRKLIWSAPLVAVFAVVGALAIFAGQTPNVAFAAPPTAPASLTATAAENGKTITLAWTADTGTPAVTSYRVQASEDGPTAFQTVATRSANGYEHSVAPGSTWFYRVYATNSDGESLPSDIMSATTLDYPGKPTVEIADTDGDPANGLSGVEETSITINWEALAGDDLGGQGASITGYQVEYSTNGSAPWFVVQAHDAAGSTTLNHEHTELMAGDTRHYRVAANNSVGLGPYSNVVMATTLDVPGMPTGLEAELIPGPSISLSWIAPTDTGGTGEELTGHLIETFDQTTGMWTPLEPQGSGDTQTTSNITAPADDESPRYEYTHSGLTVGQTVRYQVSAVNAQGRGASSLVETATWRLLDAPTALTATPTSRTEITLSWTAPAGKITGYRIEGSLDGIAWPALSLATDTGADETPYLKADTEDDKSTHTHSGLEGGDKRFYRVRAISSAGSGAYSNIVVATTFADPDMPTGLMANAQSGTQINLSWTAPSNTGGQDITGYKIEGSQLGDCTDDAADLAWATLAASNSGTTYAHMGLMAGQNWKYQVSAITDTGTSTASICASATTMAKPGMPMELTATAKEDSPSRIDLEWMAPQVDGADDPSVTGYKIEYSMTGADGWMDLKADTGSADPMYTDVGLMAGTQRFYRVSAINATGTSGPSNIANDTTDANPDAPGMPTMVMAMKDMDNPSSQINVSWMAPVDTGGTMLSGYVLQRKSGDGAFMTIAASNVASWWNALDCPMMNDAIPADATPPPGADDPSSPYCKLYGGLTAEAKEEVNAAFMAADYGTITGTSYMDMGLERMTTYTYQVKAVNSAGASMWSETAMAMTGTGNAAPMAEGMIDPVTVAEGGMSEMDVSMYFSDAEGDTLTYTAMSDMEMYATAMIDGSMLTITGVAEGSATVTVTATDADGSGMSAEQEIMVTVTADTSLGPPTITSVTVDDEDPGSPNIDVAWDNGANALSHMVLLFSTPDYDLAKPVSTRQDDGMTIFNDVAAGTYAVVVVSYDANFDWQFVFATVTVDAGN